MQHEANITDIAQKKQNEINEIGSALKNFDKKINALRPSVEDYNKLSRERKELRRTLSTKQKEARIIAEFFKGTTIFDERFPLFASNPEENHPDKNHRDTQNM